MSVMGTDNKATKTRSTMTTTTPTTEVRRDWSVRRDWTVVVRKRTANRFQAIEFAGTWAEAERMAQAVVTLTDLEAYYMSLDTTEVLTHTGRRVAITGDPIAIEELLEPCSHSLEAIAGYRVISTVHDIAGGHKSLLQFEADQYAQAVAWADNRRAHGRQATISRLYSCGHWSEDLDRYYGKRA